MKSKKFKIGDKVRQLGSVVEQEVISIKDAINSLTMRPYQIVKIQYLGGLNTLTASCNLEHVESFEEFCAAL